MEPELKIALKNLYSSRRAFLRSGIIVGTAAITGLSSATAAEPEKKEEEEVGPPEDLMREHGVLKRVLLVYGEVLRRMDAKQESSMRQFIRMYNPHEAREDTVLFPAFHKIVTPHEFDSLGEDFEKKENELFGEDGFEKMVDKVAGIEKRLGIYDLAQFTPKA